MKTTTIKLLLVLPILGVASCALPPIEDTNPLDRPGDSKSATTLHTENIREITGNPGWTP